MSGTALFLVVGTQPDGITELRLMDLYRAPSAPSAARMAYNNWKLHDVKLTRFEVTYYDEPTIGVGRVHLTNKSRIFTVNKLGEVIDVNPDPEGATG